jgi:hypothetical protein
MRVLDGTWTPYAFPDPLLFLFLEIITVIVEFVCFLVFNSSQPSEKRWKILDIAWMVGIANSVSFAVGLIIILLNIR